MKKNQERFKAPLSEINSKKIVFFIHGFGSDNMSNKFLCIKHNKIAFNYDFTKEDTLNLIENDLKFIMQRDKKVILVGHSYGGYIANNLAIKFGLNALLIAPMFINIFNLKNFKIEENCGKNKIIAFIEEDDESLPFHKMTIPKNLEIKYFKNGNHSICRENEINLAIKKLFYGDP